MPLVWYAMPLALVSRNFKKAKYQFAEQRMHSRIVEVLNYPTTLQERQSPVGVHTIDVPCASQHPRMKI